MLDDAARIEIEIRWPSDIRQVFGKVTVDQKLQVLEPTRTSKGVG